MHKPHIPRMLKVKINSKATFILIILVTILLTIPPANASQENSSDMSVKENPDIMDVTYPNGTTSYVRTVSQGIKIQHTTTVTSVVRTSIVRVDISHSLGSSDKMLEFVIVKEMQFPEEFVRTPGPLIVVLVVSILLGTIVWKEFQKKNVKPFILPLLLGKVTERLLDT